MIDTTNIKKHLENLTLDPLTYIGLTLSKLDYNILNLPENLYYDLIKNLSFYIVEKSVNKGFPISKNTAKSLAVYYIHGFKQRELKYLKS